jgi:hypothetical protein
MSALSSWRPVFPEGRLDRIYLHWTAGDYTTVYPSYHFCITFDGAAHVVDTNDLRLNMRDVRHGQSQPYVAHTARRNSFAAGISIAAMRDATPSDFGAFPLREETVDAMCRVAAAVARRYAIPIDAEHVMTHAEAASIDGYFGTAPEERWDIALLEPRAEPLTPADAATTGERLRAWIRNAGPS